MATVGSGLNVQWGFETDTTTLLSVAGADVGMCDGAIVIRTPKETRMLRADQQASPIDHMVATRDAFITATLKEVLGANLASALGAADYAGSSVVVNDTEKGQVAVVVITKGPDGSTRTITAAKAVAVGDSSWNIPYGEGQTIEAEFQCVGDMAASGQLWRSVDS